MPMLSSADLRAPNLSWLAITTIFVIFTSPEGTPAASLGIRSTGTAFSRDAGSVSFHAFRRQETGCCGGHEVGVAVRKTVFLQRRGPQALPLRKRAGRPYVSGPGIRSSWWRPPRRQRRRRQAPECEEGGVPRIIPEAAVHREDADEKRSYRTAEAVDRDPRRRDRRS